MGIEGVGGLVGENCDSIADSYSRSPVSGGESSEYIGGLVGSGVGNIASSFWDIQTCGRGWLSGWERLGGNGGLTTAEMQTASTFLQAGWDFVGETANGTADIWWIDEGKDYPLLWWEAAAIDDR